MPIVKAYGFTDLLTLVRAGSAWRFDPAGALVEVAANQPRLDYSPATLAVRGLLVEQAATNTITNPRAEGAVAGTPGAVPTGWAAGISGGALINSQVVGSGADGGIPFLDFRVWSAGPSSAGTNRLDLIGATVVAALTGQSWTASAYAQIVAGSGAGLSVAPSLRLRGNAAGGGSLESSQVLIPVGTAPLRTVPLTVTRTMSNAGTVFAQADVVFTYSLGVPFDFTVRVGAPQLCQAGLPFSPSFPPVSTPAASIRNADDLALRDISQWYSQAAGTLVLDWTPGQTTSPANRGLLMLDDTTGNNRIRLFMEPGSTAPRLAVTAGGVSVVPGTSAGSVTALSRHTLRFSYGPAGYLMSVNGAAPVSVAGALPTNISRALLGQSLPGSEFLNGWLGPRLAYYPMQYTDTAAPDGFTIRTR